MGPTTNNAEAERMAAELHHVLYEIKMLTHAVFALSERNLRNDYRNAWIESFAIHARNLNEFFGIKKKPKDDKKGYMRAGHFVEWNNSYQINGKLDARACEQVAHITFNREAPEKKTGWDVKGVYELLRVPSMEFLKAVAADETLMAWGDNRQQTEELLSFLPRIAIV
jgi:hypothetical protein